MVPGGQGESRAISCVAVVCGGEPHRPARVMPASVRVTKIGLGLDGVVIGSLSADLSLTAPDEQTDRSPPVAGSPRSIESALSCTSRRATGVEPWVAVSVWTVGVVLPGAFDGVHRLAGRGVDGLGGEVGAAKSCCVDLLPVVVDVGDRASTSQFVIYEHPNSGLLGVGAEYGGKEVDSQFGVWEISTRPVPAVGREEGRWLPSGDIGRCSGPVERRVAHLHGLPIDQA